MKAKLLIIAVLVIVMGCSKTQPEEFEVTSFEDFKLWAGNKIKLAETNKGYDIYIFDTEYIEPVEIYVGLNATASKETKCGSSLDKLNDVIYCNNTGKDCNNLGSGGLEICNWKKLRELASDETR
jgi:hypothetical protein